MIEGTKTYKKKNFFSAPIDAAPNENERPSETSSLAEEARQSSVDEKSPSKGDALNPSRRAWFQQLVPSMGLGLTKLLRESNNLEYEVKEMLHQASNKSAEK